MLVDLGNRNVEREADEEELLLLLQPHQLHLHLTLRVHVGHHKVLAAVVERQRGPGHGDADGRAGAPEGFVKLVQQRQRHDAAVLGELKQKCQSWKNTLRTYFSRYSTG